MKDFIFAFSMEPASPARPFASMPESTKPNKSFESRPQIKQQTFDEIYGVPENFLEIEVSIMLISILISS